MRARQSSERRSVDQGAAARGGRQRLESAVPHAGGLRQDDQGRRQLGLEHSPAEASQRPRHLVHAGQGDRRRLHRSTLSSTRAATPRTTTPGRARPARPAGAIARSCPISSAARTTRSSTTPITAMAGRSASPIRSIRRRSATPSCAPRRSSASRSTTISTAPCRTASATTSFPPATPSALRRRALS